MERPPDNVTTGNLLWRVAMKWRAAVDRAVAPLGLTRAQYSLLASLYGLSRHGVKPSRREPADFTGLEPIYVSKIARALEQAGLLTRAEHPADPRAVQVVPTDKAPRWCSARSPSSADSRRSCSHRWAAPRARRPSTSPAP